MIIEIVVMALIVWVVILHLRILKLEELNKGVIDVLDKTLSNQNGMNDQMINTINIIRGMIGESPLQEPDNKFTADIIDVKFGDE